MIHPERAPHPTTDPPTLRSSLCGRLGFGVKGVMTFPCAFYSSKSVRSEIAPFFEPGLADCQETEGEMRQLP